MLGIKLIVEHRPLGTVGFRALDQVLDLSKTKRTASILAKDDVSLLKINSSLIEQASTACQLRFNKVFIRTLIDASRARVNSFRTDAAGRDGSALGKIK